MTIKDTHMDTDVDQHSERGELLSLMSPIYSNASNSVFKLFSSKAPLLRQGSMCSIPHCAGSPIDMATILTPECAQCVPQCNMETCEATTESDQCTDRCLVVPCESPCLDNCSSYFTSFANPPCQSEYCQEFKGSLATSSSTDMPGQPPVHSASSSDQTNATHGCGNVQHPDWNAVSREVDALLCACCAHMHSQTYECDACDPKFLSIDHSHQYQHPPQISIPSTISLTPTPDSPAFSLLSSLGSSSMSARSTPEPAHEARPTLQSLARSSVERTSFNMLAPNNQSRSEFLQCLWAGCGLSFNNTRDLAMHVNNSHLHMSSYPTALPGREESAVRNSSLSDPKETPAVDSLSDLACRWDNCNQYASPAQIPGSSTGIMPNSAKDFLAQHVQQDHIGIRPIAQATAAWSSSTVIRTPPDATDDNNSSVRDRHTTSRPISTDKLSIQPQHFCKWKSCQHEHLSFESPAELTQHITDEHVGVGNSRYHCWWDGCTRNGDAGFTSKQKILRHVQSHTGYRPFRCELCNQSFSETATLQQHMRRHTKEKPYVCDFPGCGKAFAITGALTIHRRVHSGSKPFKCSFCDRTFSESSNLSKHIRTHTGDRPYACDYPGCGKRFARPDQASRHKNVHLKKNSKAVNPPVE